jgi:hypothetical protein
LKKRVSLVEKFGPKAINFSQFIILESQQFCANLNNGVSFKLTLQSTDPYKSLHLHSTTNSEE